MFEFYGWASIGNRPTRPSTSGAQATLTTLQRRLSELRVPGLVEVSFHQDLNGTISAVFVTGLRNHRLESVFAFFKWLGAVAPHAYGLLYVLDDEDNRGPEHANSFHVWRLVRGVLSEHQDPFLSPFVPIVEDLYDESEA